MEIGNRLRQAREGRGWSLEDVEFQTRLPKSVLRALEEDDFSVFSSSLYAKSFLSQYSAHLHVDAAEMLGAITEAEFVANEALLPIIDRKNAIPAEPVTRATAAGDGVSYMPMMVFFGVTALFLWAFFAFFQDYEKRLGVENPESRHSPATGDVPVAAERVPVSTGNSAITPVSREMPEIAERPADETVPPRAIIVR